MEVDSHADYTGPVTDRKSTTWYCMFLGGNLVSWRRNKKMFLQGLVQRLNSELWHKRCVNCY